jgi:ATP-dependent RNA helicase RhlE
VAPSISAAESVEQIAYLVDADRKRDLLAHLVRTRDLHQVLVFCRTKQMTRRLASQLDRDGVEATAIHGDRSQPERERALEQFKSGEVRVLVATDVAARGLDIEALPTVVNFEIPHDPEDYVHRIGRTGRAGVEGEAVALVCAEDRPLLAAIERLLNRSIEQRIVAGFELGTGSARGEPRAQPGRRSAPSRSSGERGAKHRPAQATQPRSQQGSRRRSGGATESRSGAAGGKSSGSAQPSRNESAGQRNGRRGGPKAQGANGNGKRSPAPGKPRSAKPEARRPQKQSAFAALLAGARRLIG